ncbi:IS3 family transposase [Changpingibacter yushuensis]|uniref:IS3 family transposase n=2 Tax=Changpingibacter yushuensis TaxID=2758440 RepID=UPI0015F72F0B|nr:IS3 family transposase [Changpingibacter yushuensis]
MRVVYSAEQKRVAVATFRRLGSYVKTIRKLGYPSRHVLHDWVHQSRRGRKPVVKRQPARHYPWTVKLSAVERMNAGQSVKDIAGDLGIVNHMLLYKWMRLWNQEGERALMTRREKREADGLATRAQLEKSLPDDPDELRRLAARLLVEKHVLEHELDLVKKDGGVIPGQLSNLNKTRIIDRLRARLPFVMLLEACAISASSYHYCRGVLERPDKYGELAGRIEKIAGDSGFTYGSARVWLKLKRLGVTVSEKVVRRLMKEHQIPVYYAHRKRRYSSYEGETSPAPDDHVKRNFHADEPDRLWLTDVSEFAASDAKVYLSPMIDCCDGKVVAWQTSRRPDKVMTQSMLEAAIASLPTERHDALRDDKEAIPLIIHSDRGGHYRSAEWIETTKAAGITRSMGKKGCSPDNAACEGFFGRMKTEMFYGHTWTSAAQLETAINDYLIFYNTERLKTSLGGTIQENRDKMEKPEPSRKQS